jgi:calcium/calmodulin-dependent protein kinase (CaM kinase) II
MNDDESAVKASLESLLSSIQRADITTYRQLVSETLTCFEPETRGNRVDGIDFHVFLTEGQEIPQRFHLELVDPVIRVYGNAAYACYTLLVSRDHEGIVTITAMNETRVFAKEQGDWKMVHFHRSRPDAAG